MSPNNKWISSIRLMTNLKMSFYSSEKHREGKEMLIRLMEGTDLQVFAERASPIVYTVTAI